MARLLPALVTAAAVAVLITPAVAASPAQKPSRNLVVQPASHVKADAKRLALVVGNNAYADAPLTNPTNNARAMAKKLEQAGFTVILRTDASYRDMLAALRDFGNGLRGGGVGLF